MLVAAATPALAQWRPERLAADGSELPPDTVGHPGPPGPLEQLDDHAARAADGGGSRAQGRERAAGGHRGDARHRRGLGWSRRGRFERDALIIDPPDGRIRMTEQGVQRLIDRESARRRPGRGRFLARPEQLGTVHLAHAPDRDDPDALQRQLPDPADAGPLRAGDGDDPRGAHRPPRRAAPRLRRHPPVARRCPRLLGGRHAGRRDAPLQRPPRRRRLPALARHPDRPAQFGRDPAPDRAVHARRRQHHRLPDRRSRTRRRSRCPTPLPSRCTVRRPT